VKGMAIQSVCGEMAVLIIVVLPNSASRWPCQDYNKNEIILLETMVRVNCAYFRRKEIKLFEY
jgi:hypothetical protein